ncbi:hypothetical protein EPN29_09240 [bacterium]|nr:MAG: hypothetical protein EPN29_09240 [bacterium]
MNQSRSSRRLRVLFLPHPIYPGLFDPWGKDVVAALRDRHDVAIYDPTASLREQFGSADVVVDHGGSAGTREMADLSSSVRLWQILGTGTDHFDLVYWRSKRIPIANCPGTFTAVGLAELAVMFMLMLARRFRVAELRFSSGDYYGPAGMELRTRRLLLLGFGASARELAKRANSFGMLTSAIDAIPITGQAVEEFCLVEAGGPERIEALLDGADFVSLHLPLNEETRHTINEHRLRLMKASAFLVNVARGELVDEHALEKALRNGQLAGAGLDVFSNEPPVPSSGLLTLPNVIATPHIAGATEEASRGRAEFVAANVERLAAGDPPLNLVV